MYKNVSTLAKDAKCFAELLLLLRAAWIGAWTDVNQEKKSITFVCIEGPLLSLSDNICDAVRRRQRMNEWITFYHYNFFTTYF